MPPNTWEIVHSVGDVAVLVASAAASLATYALKHARTNEARRMEAIADQKAAVIKLALAEHEKIDDSRFGANKADHEKLFSDNDKILERLDQIEETRAKDHQENTVKLDRLNSLDVKVSALSADVRTLMEWFRSKF
jgi:ribonuclease HI